MPDRHPKDELIHALRVCWPRKKAVQVFHDELAEQLQGSFDALSALVDGHGLKSLNKPLPEIAVSLAIGYLTDRVKKDQQPVQNETETFSQLVNTISTHDGMRDVMLTAGCVMGDDACNLVLLRTIDQHVRPPLIARWGQGKANPVLDDLPSHLLQPQKKGLGRGRVKLLAFYGRSSIKTWLKTIATRLIIDRGRRSKEVQIGPRDGDGTPDDGLDGFDGGQTDDPDCDGPIQTQLVEITVPLFQRLLELLSQESLQQYNYAVLRCVRGYQPAVIAARLQVARPRVTQLSQAVCRKFLGLLSGEDPAFSEVTEKLDRKTRHDIEAAIRDLLAADQEVDGEHDALNEQRHNAV